MAGPLHVPRKHGIFERLEEEGDVSLGIGEGNVPGADIDKADVPVSTARPGLSIELFAVDDEIGDFWDVDERL
jgi:hypothetical protein